MGRYVHISSLLNFFLIFQLSVSELPSDQKSTMKKLYQLLENSSSPFPWRLHKDQPCSWEGVTCSGPNNSSITQITLRSYSISNPDFIVNLCQIDTLEVVDLSDNQLSSIPEGFIAGCGKIRGLKKLSFSMNKLSGPLPSFTGFPMLESLDLSHNTLYGNIDSQLDVLVKLKNLSLGFNQFSGSLPTHLGNSMVLEELMLSANHFQGKIPEEIANYSSLIAIDLSVNNLSGSIPDKFRELSKLHTLVLSANNLSGEIPDFASLQSLSRFAANQNHFYGVIPAGITKNLRNLDLSYNNLSGSIPRDILSHSNLQSLDLSNNLLGGSIPENMSPSLVRLRLGNNYLNGTIPSSPFSTLQTVTYLELDGNKLTGTIPPELGLCKNLALLNLAENKLSGVLPKELSSLSKLEELKLQGNSFVGEIPNEITQSQELRKLNISLNSLTGSIPSSISRLKSLTNLDLRGNDLTGSIPDSIGALNSLMELQLGKNRLSGKIPTMPKSLQIALNLSSNFFSGPIPETLSILGALEVLDLSNNSFTGGIPDSMTRMSSLTELVLSNNQLSGEVPDFPSYVTVYKNGNNDLKNRTKSVTPPPSPKKKRTVAAAVVIAAAVAIIAVGIVTIIAVSISRRFYRINDAQMEPREELSRPQVVRGNLLTANGIHRSNIDFSKAMEEVINPSNITLKTRFSTYYKAIMPSGMSYFVKKLNWSDKIFQLGSHERFGEELEALGKLSNSNVMTPLAYVLTLDSAYIFYEFAQKGTLFDALHGSLGESLDWESRYSIAIGVAQGLAFLHGCASGPVLLLDLSSKSILLRSLKEPQIGDIEVCKVIDPTKSTGSLSAVAGSVGYIPPEYAYTMRVTMAGNVYSLGVILLELVTGKAAVSQGTELAKWVLSNTGTGKQEKVDQILDFSISRTSLAVRNQMVAVLKVALACVRASLEARPKTKSIPRMLLNAR